MPKDIRTEAEAWRQAIAPKKNEAGIVEDIRTKRPFLAGYKQGNLVIVPGYSTDLSLRQLISLFSNRSNLRQKGALAWEIEHQILKQSFKPKTERFSILFREVAGIPSQGDDFDPMASQQLSPQGLLLNLSEDGFGGRCDPLSKLVLVAKHLEGQGEKGLTHSFLEKLYAVASITNNPAHYSTLAQDNAEQLINRLREIHSNTTASYNYDTLRSIQYRIVKEKWSVADNNAMTLQQVINKLIPVEANTESGSTKDENIGRNSVLLALDAPGHAMATWARTEDDGRMYGFYDPNAGVVEFSSVAKFRQYLSGFFGKNGLNMAGEYRLPNNAFGEPVFSCVTAMDGNQLAGFKPYKNLSNPITLEQILATPVFGPSASSTTADPVEPDYISNLSKIQNDYFTDIMTRDELLQRTSAYGKETSQSYKNVLTALDTIHTTSDTERIEAAFILKNQIDDYTTDKPNSDRNHALLQITEQINDALFSDRLMPVRFSINQIARTRPALATQLLQAAIKENQTHQTLKLTALMIIAVNEDSWLRFFNGFNGEIPKVDSDNNPWNFESKFYVTLGEQFDDFKIWLLQARAEGLLDKSYLNEKTRSVHLGYSYQQLSELAANNKVRMAFYFLKEAVKKARSAESTQQLDEVMLDKFADKNYIRKLQTVRLAQIEKTYQSNQQTDIDNWDKQYAGAARDQLNNLLNRQPDVNKQLALLLDNRNGLLIRQANDVSLNTHGFIIEQMATLKAQGVTTIGLANLRKELIQPIIDDYLATGQIAGELAAIISNKSLGSLFSKAYQTGMKIVALDTDSSITSASGHAVIYQTAAVTNSAVETLSQLPKGEKFIAIYHQQNLQSHQGIDSFLPGIAQRMGLPILTLDSNSKFQLAEDDLSQRKRCDDVISLPRTLFGDNRYDYQVIIHLSKNTRGIAPLVNKHPGKTVVIYYDIDSDHSLILRGNLPQHSGNKVRWILDGLSNSSGYSAAQVYAGLKKLAQQQSLTLPQRIELLGCKLGNNINQQGFHDNFAQALISKIYADDKNTTVSVRAYSTHVDINSRGQRVTHPEGHTRYSYLRESRHLVDLHWNYGLLQSNNIPVILYVATDIFSKKLSVGQAIQRYSAVLAWGFSGPDGVLDRALISKLVGHPIRMDRFIAHVMRAIPDPQRWQGSHHLHNVFNMQDRLASGSASQQNIPFLSSASVQKWGNIPIAQPSGIQADNDFNYDYQVIIQLEQEQLVHQSVERLTSKHPHKTLVIQYNIDSGESRRVYGDPQQLTGSNVRWLLVGHGRREGTTETNTTIGDATPSALSKSLKALLAAQSLTSPARVVLAGCNLGHAHNGDNFALRLIHLLHREGINASVQAYSTDMAVNVAGHRLTAGDDPQGETLWLKKNSAHRVSYQLNTRGVFMVNEFPAALLIMADIAGGKITYDRAAEEYTDILKYYFPTPDAELDHLLLKQTVSDPQQFDKFIDYLETTQSGQGNPPKDFSAWLAVSQQVLELLSADQLLSLARSMASSHQQDLRQEPLGKRIHNTIKIMHDLAAGTVKFTELSNYQRHCFNDFFQRLDIRRLILTLSSKLHYRAFYHELHELLQLGEHHPQLQNISGWQALHRSKSWNNRQVENIVSLQQAVDKNKTPGITSQVNITLNTLYIHDGSQQAGQQAARAGLAWLHALSLGEPERERFLNGLNTAARINELSAIESLPNAEVAQSDRFHSLINQLSNKNHLDQRYFTALGRHILEQGLQKLLSYNQDGYYLLVTNNHALGLARRMLGGQQKYYLYNPDLGEINLTSQNPLETISTLKNILYDYLNSKNHTRTLADQYAVLLFDNKLSFDIYQMNAANVAGIPVLKDLQQLLDTGFGTAGQRIPPHNPRWQTIDRVTRGIGQVTQLYGYYQVMAQLGEYWRSINKQNITPQETQALALELSITLGHLSLDVSEQGLHKLGNRLVSNTLSNPLKGLSCSRMDRLNFVAGMKLIRFSGPLLGIASSGFDIYDAYRHFSRLDNPLLPLLRQDLIVQGSLSVLSAAVGISTSVAIAAGGTAMKVAGPLGIIMGAATIIGSRIYVAARQITDIKKYVTLGTGEELRNSWYLFAGQYVESDLHNRLAAAHTKEEARASYNQMLEEQADKLLADALQIHGIDTYYYSRGEFDLEEHTYLRLMGKEVETKRSNTLGNRNLSYSSRKTLEDRILLPQAAAVLQKHQQALFSQKPRYIELAIEDSEYHFYTPTPLRPVKDQINADSNLLSGGAAKAVFQPPAAKEPHNTTPQKTEELQETSALFDLGDDDDTVAGHLAKKNSFMIRAGQKHFTGGQRADSFLLMGLPAPEHASELDGGTTPPTGERPVTDAGTARSADNDIVIAVNRPVSGGGYAIDLDKGTVNYLSMDNRRLANLQHIEHASGHAQTNDILIGNEQNNSLNGMGGLDKLYGNGGDDVLALADGYAEGGPGIDTYCILQNIQPQHASIRITDTSSKTEVNNIRLDYKVVQINAIELMLDDSVMLTLNNDNGTLTTLTLTNIYRLADTDDRLELINEYILYTRDGMLLLPDWPRTITRNQQGKWPFSPTLIGRYNPLLDSHWQTKFTDQNPAEEARIHLQRRDSSGHARITIGNTRTVLPAFIQLATEGTPLNDLLEGDDSNNWLRGYQGSDTLIGRGGSDIYEIYRQQGNGTEITIDNYDDYPTAPGQQPDTDFLLLRQPIQHIVAEQDGADLLLRVDTLPNYPRVRIRNFMADERNRHLVLIDKNGQNYQLDFDDMQQPRISDQYSQAQPSQHSDYIMISALTADLLDALAGDDVIADQTEVGRTLHGGPGNDIIVVTGGDNNWLYGDSGNDELYGGSQSDIISGGSGNDTLSGGPGNDILQDFQGDDLYLFSPGDGQDIIRDLYGTNTLRFSGNEMKTNNLWFKRQGERLAVLVSVQDSGDSVILEGYFTQSPDNISNIIEVAGRQLRGKDIALLAEVMSNFPVFEYNNPSTGLPNAVQQRIDALWLEVPSSNILTH